VQFASLQYELADRELTVRLGDASTGFGISRGVYRLHAQREPDLSL
jgi:hypothetical protein